MDANRKIVVSIKKILIMEIIFREIDEIDVSQRVGKREGGEKGREADGPCKVPLPSPLTAEDRVIV